MPTFLRISGATQLLAGLLALTITACSDTQQGSAIEPQIPEQHSVEAFLTSFDNAIINNDNKKFLSFFAKDLKVSGQFDLNVDGEVFPTETNNLDYEQFAEAMQHSLQDSEVSVQIEVKQVEFSLEEVTGLIKVSRKVDYFYTMPYGDAHDVRHEIFLIEKTKNAEASQPAKYQVVNLHLTSYLSVKTNITIDHTPADHSTGTSATSSAN